MALLDCDQRRMKKKKMFLKSNYVWKCILHANETQSGPRKQLRTLKVLQKTTVWYIKNTALDQGRHWRGTDSLHVLLFVLLVFSVYLRLTLMKTSSTSLFSHNPQVTRTGVYSILVFFVLYRSPLWLQVHKRSWSICGFLNITNF